MCNFRMPQDLTTLNRLGCVLRVRRQDVRLAGQCTSLKAFYPHAMQLTDSHRFAEMETVEKNKISHRGLGLKKLQEWFKNKDESC